MRLSEYLRQRFVEQPQRPQKRPEREVSRREKPRLRRYTQEELISLVLRYMRENPHDPDVVHARKMLPARPWNGLRKGGGGWAGAWWTLLSILAKAMR